MSRLRVRFAPSPTGYLHIGGARTALFNYLLARREGGAFVLRIEDTDAARSTGEAVDAILHAMEWLGLDWDEGPFYQSSRVELHLSRVEQLLAEGKAYRCYCTPDELAAKREKALAQGGKPKYDGTCRERTDQPEGAPYVVRFRAPGEGETSFVDRIKGPVRVANEELDDLVLLRSDGSPTYNLVVVLDDAEMGINLVLRGDDHLSNTPRQILLYEALGYPVPEFAHVPLILGTDRTRLSKRHGATSVMAYRDQGYLPEALVNYLVRLGWSHGDQEIFAREELVELFSLDQVGRSASIFNPEKLLWLNHHYIKTGDPESIADLLVPFLRQEGFNPAAGPQPAAVVLTLSERSETLAQMARQADFFYLAEPIFDPEAEAKWLVPEKRPLLKALVADLERCGDWSETGIEQCFGAFLEEQGIKLGKIGPVVRVALTGRTQSPGLFEVMHVLGRERTLERLRRAAERIG